MSSSSLIRWSGLAAMLGGALWAAGAVLTASKPRGCIGAECAFRPMREFGALDAVVALLAVLLLTVGVAGLVVLARSVGRFGKMGKTGVVIGAVGAALIVIASLIQAVFFGGDFPLMPFFVLPGLLAVVVGFVLLGVAILRARVLPRWAAAVLIVGALAMLGANEQTAWVLMSIPLGIAWVTVGYLLWSGSRMGEVTRQTSRVR
jgi:hypothetical protein